MLGFVAGFSLLSLGSASAQEGKFAIGARTSTLGIGVEIVGDLHPKVNVRASGNYFPYSYTGTQDGVRYKIDLNLKSGLVTLDYHPTGGGVRLSGGLMMNGNKLDMKSDQISGTFAIGNQSYSVADVGSLTGNVGFKSVVPYFALGFGNAVGQGKRIGFNLSLGVALQGSPEVDLSASGPIASQQDFRTQLAAEENSVQDSLDPFKWYPVIAIGITLRP